MRLAIIGGGPAGYSAAFEAAAQGIDTVLIENKGLGGRCLREGCIPTKSLRASADAFVLAKRLSGFGVFGFSDAQLDLPTVQKRKEKIIATLLAGLEKTASNFSIKYLQGHARLLTPNEVLIQSPDDEQILRCDKILIATGSQDRCLAASLPDGKHILSSSQALALSQVPKSIIILGGGVIGSELACIFRAFGSEVCIVEARERILPLDEIDSDISKLLAKEMRKRKIKLLLNSSLENAFVSDDQINASVKTSQPLKLRSHESCQTLKADMLIIAAGTSPNSANLGLNDLGIKTKDGWIMVDSNLETSQKGIYAAGDILGPAHFQLAHVAAMEGLSIIDTLLGKGRQINYKTVPYAIFTEPEIACAGLTEQEARAQYDNVACAALQTRELGKAQTMGELPGFFKIIVNSANSRILGAQIMSAHASDLIAEISLALSAELKIEDLAHTIHAHPTLAEGIWEAARKIKL